MCCCHTLDHIIISYVILCQYHLAVNFVTPPSQCSISPLPLKQLNHVLENSLKLSLTSSVFNDGVTFISGIHLPKSMAGSHTWKSESGEYLKISWQPSRLICGTGGCLWSSFFNAMNVNWLFFNVMLCKFFARPRDLELKQYYLFKNWKG